METIFNEVFTAEQKMSPSEFQAWISSIRSTQGSGVLRLRTPSTEVNIYFLSHGNWHTSKTNDGDNDVQIEMEFNEDVFGAFIPLSTLGMVHFNLLLSASQFQTKAFFDTRGNPVNGTDPYMIKMSMGHPVGSILYNGFSELPHSLLIAENNILDEVGIPDQLLQWKNDPVCAVTIFSFDPSLDAWQELALRKSVKYLYDRMLERCEIQTGRSIVESFTRIVAMFAAEQDINVSIIGRQWVNNEFFISTEDAAYYYRLAFNELLDHFSAVLGSRLLSSNLREVFAALPGGSREVIKRNMILPEGYFS